MPDLVVEELSFRYPGAAQPALSRVSLRIPRGEFVLVAGPSGCGKSTLALALCGVVPGRIRGRCSGSVMLDGLALAGLGPAQIAERVGMVFQDPSSQLVTPTVETEVAFGPENMGLPREQIAGRVEQALAVTGCSRLRRATTASLSGGEKQRVAIAATLAMRPQVLVLDEPCSDLDPAGTQQVLAVIRRLNREHGMTVVLVEHRIDEVVPWVDRVVLLDRGSVVLDRPAAHAFDDPDRWDDLGVAVPEMVRLALAVPQLFPGGAPLSVAAAHDALSGTPAGDRIGRWGSSTCASIGVRIDGVSETGTDGCPDDPLIRWDGVEVAYEGRPVLSGVDLHARRGDWLAVVGPNGSGKTSLVELAMGFRSPDAGRVQLDGRTVNPSDVSRQTGQLGYLFQAADSMLFTSSVADELGFALRHRRRGRSRRRVDRSLEHAGTQARIEDLLELTGLAGRRDADPFTLSAGQRQRLAIAALLVDVPGGLILDEPTTGQDEGHARAMLQFLDDLRRRERLTYVMVTHDMRAVAAYATRVAVLDGGRIVLDGPPGRVFAAADTLAAAHLIPPPVADLHARLAPAPPDRVMLTLEELLATVDSTPLAVAW